MATVTMEKDVFFFKCLQIFYDANVLSLTPCFHIASSFLVTVVLIIFATASTFEKKKRMNLDAPWRLVNRGEPRSTTTSYAGG